MSGATATGRRGAFISFEGIDGSGKSTQAKALAASLGAHLTREPGGSPGAEEIRRLLVEGDAGRWSPETEILLFTAARRDHLERTIMPRVERGEHVVSDRFADSTRVYQGVARATLVDLVNLMHGEIIGIEPDLTFVVDVDPEVALTRGLARRSGEDRFESLGLGFQERLRQGFISLARDYPFRIQVIDGNRATDEIAADVLDKAVTFMIAHGYD